jgi:hypothetical protein
MGRHQRDLLWFILLGFAAFGVSQTQPPAETDDNGGHTDTDPTPDCNDI